MAWRGVQMKATADASYYSKLQAAEGNRVRLSPRYLQEQLLRRMANTTKRYYGKNLADILGQLDRSNADVAAAAEAAAAEGAAGGGGGGVGGGEATAADGSSDTAK